MSKKFSKTLLTALLLLVTIVSMSFCYATDGQVNNTTNTATDSTTTAETTQNEEAAEDEIYNGDLYLFDNNIVMDKLVDGNAFIFGDNVEVTGQVNGNLFVFANTLSLNECYVRYSIFACAGSIYYNGACNDLYAASSNLEMTYDSYVIRDVKAVASDVILKAAIGRDVDLACNKVNFGEDESIPVIYGNLRYAAASEATIPEGVINGDGSATYSKLTSTTTTSVKNILVGFLTCIVTVLVIYGLTKVCAPNFSEKLSCQKLSVLKIFKALGIGIATFLIVFILTVLLLTIMLGLNLALILVLLFILLCLVAVPAFAIIITNILKPAFKIEKNSMFCLVLVLVSIVLYGVTIIPVVGVIISLIIKAIGIGLLVDMFLPKKELSDDEKAAIQEAKKQAKELKEKKKQEKLEAKQAKKKENE